jgi:hypothetical protein
VLLSKEWSVADTDGVSSQVHNSNHDEAMLAVLARLTVMCHVAK